MSTERFDAGNSAALYTFGLNDDLNGRRVASDDLVALLESATDGRSTVIALGVVLAAHESQTGVHSWRNPALGTTRYLQALANWGYQLSEVERVAIGEGVQS